MNNWLVLMVSVFGLSATIPACASGDDDDSSGDGDADSDADGDGDADPSCSLVEETAPTCLPDGLDAPPDLLEPGCGGLSNHNVRLDVKIADTASRVHRDIAYPFLSISVSARDPETFPISDSLQALVNGCEIPASTTVPYTWTFEGDDDMIIGVSAGKYAVFEVRERGAGAEEGARLFYRQALQMPAALPNIQTPATDEVLPAPGRNVRIVVTWDPFDLDEAAWASTRAIELRAYIQGGGANQLIEDPNVLSGIDGTRGEATWNAGAFSDWDFIRMKASLFGQGQAESISINVVRSVN